MRRTYRSKKDAGDGLDHRDVLRNMDEKSSAFDAFYIRNIKQTKREFSSIASSNYVGTSKKVRNKKYVKRIVKAINPLHQIDTLSSSAYLTPDKSIRVNKVLDPFDMLLNSSPMNKECPEHVAVEAYGPKRYLLYVIHLLRSYKDHKISDPCIFLDSDSDILAFISARMSKSVRKSS